ncbi:MAG TPA: hypothetical protein VGI39_12520 [Polyangiaceae bacterium]|jgi:hypothetical protein
MRCLVAVLLFSSSQLVACHASQAAAAKDPLRCERDPNCAKHERAFDCSAQCVDDSACVERCNEIQQQTGASAPH